MRNQTEGLESDKLVDVIKSFVDADIFILTIGRQEEFRKDGHMKRS